MSKNANYESEVKQLKPFQDETTRYISILDSAKANSIIFLQLRWFGKSLTLSMLQYFNGVQYRGQSDKLFKGLEVNKDVKENKVIPGKYLILKFDFSAVRYKHDLNEAGEELALNSIRSLKVFYEVYYHYLGGSLGQQISEKINQRSAMDSLANLVMPMGITSVVTRSLNLGSTEIQVWNIFRQVLDTFRLNLRLIVSASRKMDPEVATAPRYSFRNKDQDNQQQSFDIDRLRYTSGD
ncbi:hypothetical protein HOY82DRAFT_603200 [Tuber indicum]|nr:hypothetical protein HOY82DRAFT_603200 [Tuber indicum]